MRGSDVETMCKNRISRSYGTPSTRVMFTFGDLLRAFSRAPALCLATIDSR